MTSLAATAAKKFGDQVILALDKNTNNTNTSTKSNTYVPLNVNVQFLAPATVGPVPLRFAVTERTGVVGNSTNSRNNGTSDVTKKKLKNRVSVTVDVLQNNVLIATFQVILLLAKRNSTKQNQNISNSDAEPLLTRCFDGAMETASAVNKVIDENFKGITASSSNKSPLLMNVMAPLRPILPPTYSINHGVDLLMIDDSNMDFQKVLAEEHENGTSFSGQKSSTNFTRSAEKVKNFMDNLDEIVKQTTEASTIPENDKTSSPKSSNFPRSAPAHFLKTSGVGFLRSPEFSDKEEAALYKKYNLQPYYRSFARFVDSRVVDAKAILMFLDLMTPPVLAISPTPWMPTVAAQFNLYTNADRSAATYGVFDAVEECRNDRNNSSDSDNSTAFSRWVLMELRLRVVEHGLLEQDTAIWDVTGQRLLGRSRQMAQVMMRGAKGLRGESKL